MTVAAVCDLAEVMLREQCERQVLADRQAYAAAHVDPKEWPTVAARWDDLWSLVCQDHDAGGPLTEEQELRKALGVL